MSRDSTGKLSATVPDTAAGGVFLSALATSSLLLDMVQRGEITKARADTFIQQFGVIADRYYKESGLL